MNNPKNVWNIPVSWEMFGMLRIPKSEAKTLSDAIELVKQRIADDEVVVPNGEYVESSMYLSLDPIKQAEDFNALVCYNPDARENHDGQIDAV